MTKILLNEQQMPAKKKPGSVHTAKNGARYKILANGRARFISGPTKKKGKRKGGSVSVGGAARKRKGGSARVGGAARRRRGGGLGLGKHLRNLNPAVYDGIKTAGNFILH